MRAFRPDCRHFTGEKPCAPHKAEGVVCEGCPRYEKALGRVLVIKLDAAGDVLRSTALLPALRLAHPGCALWWVTDPSSRPLLEMNPQIDVLLPVDPVLPALLSAVPFQAAYNFDMGRRAASLLHSALSPVKKGYGLSPEGAVVPLDRAAEPWFEMGIFDDAKKANGKTYQYHLFHAAGLTYAGEKPQLGLSKSEWAVAEAYAGKNKLARFKGILGLNVGAGGRWPMKRWRLEGFTWLVRKLKAKHPKLGILLYGGPEERESLPALERKLKGLCLSTGTGNSLRHFAALVGLSDLLVTGDTMALHVALALGRRVVAYFGPTSDVEIDLYGLGEKILPDRPCQCYYQAQCTQKVSCMDNLPEEKMLAAVERQLKIIRH